VPKTQTYFLMPFSESHRVPGTFEPVTGYRAGGPHGLEAGEWNDDTSMALAPAASMAEVGWDLNDQSRRYVRWWRHGEYSVNGRCFGHATARSGRTGVPVFGRVWSTLRGGPDPRRSNSTRFLAPCFASVCPGRVFGRLAGSHACRAAKVVLSPGSAA
jgi:hypothetical protein